MTINPTGAVIGLVLAVASFLYLVLFIGSLGAAVAHWIVTGHWPSTDEQRQW